MNIQSSVFPAGEVPKNFENWFKKVKEWNYHPTVKSKIETVPDFSERKEIIYKTTHDIACGLFGRLVTVKRYVRTI